MAAASFQKALRPLVEFQDPSQTPGHLGSTAGLSPSLASLVPQDYPRSFEASLRNFGSSTEAFEVAAKPLANLSTDECVQEDLRTTVEKKFTTLKTFSYDPVQSDPVFLEEPSVDVEQYSSCTLF